MGNGRLTGKNAIIFGGGGRIGSATARCFFEHGAHVLLIDRDEEKARALAQTLGDPSRCRYWAQSIENERDAERLSDWIDTQGVVPDILVNCPAYISRAPFLSSSIEEFDKQMHTNVRLVLIVSRVIAQKMAKAKKGKLSLIHISEPTRLLSISYAVFCLQKKTTLHTLLTCKLRTPSTTETA